MINSEIINIISGHLIFFQRNIGVQNKFNAFIKLYDFLMTIPDFLMKNNNFKIKVIDKLNELKNEPILKDYNDNRIDNREFLFSKFKIYEDFLRNLENANKIIIKI
jgi:hypothetical protein